jgi:hypothetical protein
MRFDFLDRENAVVLTVVENGGLQRQGRLPSGVARKTYSVFRNDELTKGPDGDGDTEGA